MKKIEAIIRKTKFEEVKEALLSSDIDWFEYHNVHGIGQSRQERIYRGVQYSTDVIERVALTIVCRDPLVEPTVKVILKTAHTGYGCYWQPCWFSGCSRALRCVRLVLRVVRTRQTS